MRGPGETQLETDRRLLRERVKNINGRLAKVRAQRDLNRRARKRSEVPTVAIVGYTNAGKSTLFNALTESVVYAADQLFATLDPTLRRLQVTDLGEVVLADTVGFIRHLPHKLVEAFRATLQEAAEADLLLHVIDAASIDRDSNIREVEKVLQEIGADTLPQLRVYNKIDLMPQPQARLDMNEDGKPAVVWVSAREQMGFAELQQGIAGLLGEELFDEGIDLRPEDARLRALLYEEGAVRSEAFGEDGGMKLQVRMQLQDFRRVLARAGIREDRFLNIQTDPW